MKKTKRFLSAALAAAVFGSMSAYVVMAEGEETVTPTSAAWVGASGSWNPTAAGELSYDDGVISFEKFDDLNTLTPVTLGGFSGKAPFVVTVDVSSLGITDATASIELSGTNFDDGKSTASAAEAKAAGNLVDNNTMRFYFDAATIEASNNDGQNGSPAWGGKSHWAKDEDTGIYSRKNPITITVGDKSVSFDVKAKAATYQISCLSVKGIGHYKVSTNNAAPGTEIIVEIEPLAGYTLEKITYKNKTTDETVDITDGKFTMPAADVQIIPVFTAAPKYNATAVSKTFPAGFTDPDRKAAAEKITNKISKAEVKNGKVVVTFNDTYANIKNIMDGDDLLKVAAPTGVDPIYLDITTDIPIIFDGDDFEWKTGYGWDDADKSLNFNNGHIMLWLNPANSAKTITYTVGSERVQTLTIEYSYKSTTSTGGSGSTTKPTTTTTKPAADPTKNPPTGIALATAPVILAAGAVIVAAKKRK